MALITNPSTINTPATQEIGTYHLADNPNLYEVQRTNNFELIITGDGFISGTQLFRPGTEDSPFDGSLAQEVLRLAVEAASVPHFQQNPITIKRGNNELKYAGVPTFNSGQLTVVDYIGVDVKSMLMAWQNLSYNVQTEKVGLASDYKKDCVLVEYSPDYQIVRKWNLHGCWISNITESGYNNNTNEANKLTVTVEYDRAEIDNSEL